jgi:hypothetical protein
MIHAYLAPFVVLALLGEARNAIGVPAAASTPSATRSVPSNSALEAWRRTWGEGWRLAEDSQTGFASMIYGGTAGPSSSTQLDSEVADLAWNHAAETFQMHGIDPASLFLSSPGVQFLPLGLTHRGTDKISVRFDQLVGSLPVVEGTLNVLLDTSGRLLSLQSTASPFIGDMDVTPNKKSSCNVFAF